MQGDKSARSDLIDRYVYQVVKRLPQAQRADIEKELRGLIDDMLAARSGDPTKEDVEAVLQELGNPSVLAAKYKGNARSLIGPEYFDMYWFVLKIVLSAVALGMCVAQIVGNITNPPETVWTAIGMFFGTIFSGLVQAFAWVTVIFALAERFAKGKPWQEEWKPADLPPVPVQQAVIKRSEPIVSIVFSILWLILITSAPQLLGAYIAPAGEVTDIMHNLPSLVPVFDLTVLRSLMPLVVLITGLGILKEVLRLAEGRYTVRLAVAMTVLNAVSLMLVIWVYGSSAIWNPDFATSLNAAWSAGSVAANIWSVVPKVIVGLTAFGIVVESITAFARALRHREAAGVSA